MLGMSNDELCILLCITLFFLVYLRSYEARM